MSTIKANAYLDASGGNTATVNGTLIPASGVTLVSTAATQTLTNKSIAASQLTGALPAIDGSALTGFTATQIGAATAGAAVGSVGSYAMLQSALTRAIGASVAGSSLLYFGLNTGGVSSGTAPSGTWMLMGNLSGGTNQGSVWLRTA
jgi:hypothetical protein